MCGGEGEPKNAYRFGGDNISNSDYALVEINICDDCEQEEFACCNNCGELTERGFSSEIEESGEYICPKCEDENATN